MFSFFKDSSVLATTSLLMIQFVEASIGFEKQNEADTCYDVLTFQTSRKKCWLVEKQTWYCIWYRNSGFNNLRVSKQFKWSYFILFTL